MMDELNDLDDNKPEYRDFVSSNNVTPGASLDTYMFDRLVSSEFRVACWRRNTISNRTVMVDNAAGTIHNPQHHVCSCDELVPLIYIINILY